MTMQEHDEHDAKAADDKPKKKTLTAEEIAARPGGHRRTLWQRYPLIIVAVILAVFIIGGATLYAQKRNHDSQTAQGSFDPKSVLPQSVSQPAQPESETSAVYTADTLKQFDGKDGHKCYVAVNGTVYDIENNQYWKDGEHTPSGGRGMCGGDMSEVIKESPHGTSVLESLPKVGTYKS